VELDPLFGLLREELCLVTNQSPNAVVNMNDLNNRGPKASGRRQRLVIAFSLRVRQESGITDSTYQFQEMSRTEKLFASLWRPDRDGVVLFDRLEARYQERKQ
jgi:hypothetical protein